MNGPQVGRLDPAPGARRRRGTVRGLMWARARRSDSRRAGRVAPRLIGTAYTVIGVYTAYIGVKIALS